MAEYIDDSGAYNMDALFSGAKGTDYDYDATENAVWFSSTGQANSDFILPDSEWLVYEVYAMTGTGITNTLSGSTKLRSMIEFTTDLTGGITSVLSAWKTAYGTPYTTYKVRATHYGGSDLADIYFADEGEGFSKTGGTEEGSSNVSYTPSGTDWLLKDELLAESLIGETVYETSYVSLESGGTTPTLMDSGDYTTVLNQHSSTTADVTLVTDNRNDTLASVLQTAVFYWYHTDGRDSGSNSYILPDDLISTCFSTRESDYNGIIKLVDLQPSSDYTLTFANSSLSGSGEITEVDVDGTTQEIGDAYATTPNSTSFDITTDATPSDVVITVKAKAGSTYGYLSGFKVERKTDLNATDVFSNMSATQVDSPGTQTSVYNESGDTFDLAVTATGDNNARPYIRFELTGDTTIGKTYILQWDTTNTSGTVEADYALFDGGTTISPYKTIFDGVTFIPLTADVVGGHIDLFFDGSSNGTWSFDAANVKVLEL